jgi:hypothetical protein
MLRELELDHFATQSEFIRPRAARLTDVNAARTQAKANPPPGFSQAVRAAFEADIDQTASPAQVVAAYLKYAGIKLTNNTFP